MSRREQVQRGIAVTCALAAGALMVLGLGVVYGLSAEYSGGTGLQLLPLVVLTAGGATGLATFSWPGLRPTLRIGVPLAVIVALGLGGVAADRLGGHVRDQRLVSQSESFTCNGPHAEIQVDSRVDETFDALPRRAPIYGPVEGSRYGCTAAVDGDGAATFAAYADAFRDLDGWTVLDDRPDRFVMERDGVRVVMRLEGAPHQLAMIEVSVPDAP